jgi:hypothetical protein
MAALDKGIARRVNGRSNASPMPRGQRKRPQVSTRPSIASASATAESAFIWTTRPPRFFASATVAKPAAERRRFLTAKRKMGREEFARDD